jgi:hypothetical protein
MRLPYGDIRKEISIREEFLRTMDGTIQEIAKKQTGLLRLIRRDANNVLVPCACHDALTHEGDKDHYCPYCLGEGHLWDETYVDFYRWDSSSDYQRALADTIVQPGVLNVPLRIFYLKYNKNLTVEDRVIELALDNDGNVASPIRRRAIHSLSTVYDYRCDDGRIEYWKVIGFENKQLTLNAR